MIVDIALIAQAMSLASCCDGPDCQPAPYGTGEAWYGLGVHNGGKWVQESLFFCLVLIFFRVAP